MIFFKYTIEKNAPCKKKNVLDVALPANISNPEDIEDMGEPIYVPRVPSPWFLVRHITMCRTYSGCLLSQWWAGRKKRKIAGSIFSDIMSPRMTCTAGWRRRMLVVHGRGSRVCSRRWPSLEVPHSSTPTFFFFFFFCVNLVLWLNTMFYALDSFCFRLFFFFWFWLWVWELGSWNGDGVWKEKIGAGRLGLVVRKE